MSPSVPLTPPDFKPDLTDPMYFNPPMLVVGPGNSPGQITESWVPSSYCATLHTAQVMMQILASLSPVKIVSLPPLGKWSASSPFLQIGVVPWLLFSNGVLENAGLLATGWTHGYPNSYVEGFTLKGVQGDINEAAEAQQQG